MKTIVRYLVMVSCSAFSCSSFGQEASWEIYQTSRSGDEMALRTSESNESPAVKVLLDPIRRYQTIVGIGGAFTESTADALSVLSSEKRREVIEAYFSPEGAHYSLTRTHVGSCDFSLGSYSYAENPDDPEMASFSIERDKELLLPLIKDSQSVAGADFKILASPWTAPRWMKDNGEWFGGKLKPEMNDSFADYLGKYLDAYEREGVPIWGLTPMNEPEGNDANWESMEFSPEEMRDFVRDSLGPKFRREKRDTKILVFDQNRDHMEKWAKVVYGDKEAAQYIDGMAVHWYSSTISVCPDALDSVHEDYPDKMIMHTEGCIDALGDDEPIGSWLEKDWWWRYEATDWGVFWAPEELKPDHPAYAPVYRYAGDIIGGLNHWMSGWIDWNMVLDERGGPNHVKNFCGAPIMVNRETKEVLYTPLYYAMCHFSRFIRPGAKRIGFEMTGESIEGTAVLNQDGSIVAVLLNREKEDIVYELSCSDESRTLEMPAESIQTIVLR